MRQRDIVIIGAGHNGLVAACYLAQAGLKPLVLERRAVVGGIATTEDLDSGFRCPGVLHTCGPLHRTIIRDLQLEQHGLRPIEHDLRLFAPLPDGRALRLYASPDRSATELAQFSQSDGTRYPEFCRTVSRLSEVIGSLLTRTPPALEKTTTGDLWLLLEAGRRMRALSKRDRVSLARWLTMPVADVVEEWFESEPLQAALAGRGLVGTFMGPRSAGTALTFLMAAATGGHPLGSDTTVAGGPGALSEALASAATAAGAEIRTQAEVNEIAIQNGSAVGVVLSTGEQIEAPTVVSSADPKQTFLHLIAPEHLDPDFRALIQNYRSTGAMAKVNLALSGPPSFTSLAASEETSRREALSGWIHIGPQIDYLETAFDAAKYGSFAPRPVLEVTIPSLLDPSLAPAGRHVMSIYALFVPYSPPHPDPRRFSQSSWGPTPTRAAPQLGDSLVAAAAGASAGAGSDLREGPWTDPLSPGTPAAAAEHEGARQPRVGVGPHEQREMSERVRVRGRDAHRERLADAVVETLSAYAPDLPQLIVGRQVMTPEDLEVIYGLTGGHVFHGEPALDQLFSLRPVPEWSRYRTPIRRLYLCGSGTHPGYGLTGCSGVNASREILKDLRRRG